MEEAEARLFWPTPDMIGSDHVLDEFIASRLSPGLPGECALCNEPSRIVFSFDDLLDIAVATIRHYRGRAIDDLYHDSESDSGYAFPGDAIEDTPDVVAALFEEALDDQLLTEVGERVADESWYQPGVLWLQGAELLTTSWKGFRTLVLDAEARAGPVTVNQVLAGRLDPANWYGPQADGHKPSQVLSELLEVFNQSQSLAIVPPSQRWYRAVHTPADTPVTASRIGTVPSHLAVAENRMSRAGNPMFYAASDSSTAIAEIGPKSSADVTVVGEWRPSRPLRLLDLVSEPALPSMYDLAKSKLRGQLEFLRGFAQDVSRPLGPHGPVEYRATQLMMEFLRLPRGAIDGIMYRSSLGGGVCCAIRASNAQCVAAPTATQPVELILTGHVTLR